MEEKGLQKFTVKQKVKALFEQKIITWADLKNVITTKEDVNAFNTEFNRRLSEFQSEEKDEFLKQVDEILTEDTKNLIWENNHLEITQFLNQYISEYGQMPNKSRIARGTKLSRQTVHKHFKEYCSSAIYQEQYDQFKIMKDKVLAMVFQVAKMGDIKACRLFLEMVSDKPISKIGQEQTSATVQNTQNNYIQINNLKIEQGQISNLSPEQLKVLESVFAK